MSQSFFNKGTENIFMLPPNIYLFEKVKCENDKVLKLENMREIVDDSATRRLKKIIFWKQYIFHPSLRDWQLSLLNSKNKMVKKKFSLILLIGISKSRYHSRTGRSWNVKYNRSYYSQAIELEFKYQPRLEKTCFTDTRGGLTWTWTNLINHIWC